MRDSDSNAFCRQVAIVSEREQLYTKCQVLRRVRSDTAWNGARAGGRFRWPALLVSAPWRDRRPAEDATAFAGLCFCGSASRTIVA